MEKIRGLSPQNAPKLSKQPSLSDDDSNSTKSTSSDSHTKPNSVPSVTNQPLQTASCIPGIPAQNAELVPKSRNMMVYGICALVLALAYVISSILAIILFAVFCIIYACRSRIMKTMMWKKLQLYLMYRDVAKLSRSINQTQVLITKRVLGLPIDENENEIKSFNDIKAYFGDKFPFMKEIRDTNNDIITVEGNPCRCISSYSYLNLTEDARVNEAAIQATRGYSAGNHGPRMLCGNLEILEELERKIAKFFNREAALVCSSGYLATMSAVAGVARPGDFLLMDKLCHASLKAGMRISGVSAHYFKHNDFEDAARIIKSKKKSSQRMIMVIEGIYSMDGDVGKLDIARTLCDENNGFLIMDEAHSLGSLGETGHGTEEYYGYKYKADVICGTFSKSIGTVGGYMTCSAELRRFYTFYAPGAVFSAPLSAYHAGAAMKGFEIIENEPNLPKSCQKNAQYLRDKFRENNFNIGHSVTCVIPVIFNDPIQCINIHEFLLKNGYFTACVMAPACPVLEPRFRICATAKMTKNEMDAIIDIFIIARDEVPVNETFAEIRRILA